MGALRRAFALDRAQSNHPMQTSFQPLIAVPSLLVGLLLLGVGACDLSGAVPSDWGLAKYSQERVRQRVVESAGGEDSEGFDESFDAAEAEIKAAMESLFGTAKAPHWPMGRSGADAPALLATSAAAYQAECAHCHGPEGFGNGPSSIHLKPVPWNFAIGVFPRTAPNGGMPKTKDLTELLSKGIDGASMPPFKRLGEETLIGISGHVLLLARRAQIEPWLVDAWLRGGPGSLSADSALEIYLAWESGKTRASLNSIPNKN
jgi:mono/diheme cytochrome c family protein